MLKPAISSLVLNILYINIDSHSPRTALPYFVKNFQNYCKCVIGYKLHMCFHACSGENT